MKLEPVLGGLAAKARPKQTSLPRSSSPTVTIPLQMRKWIDVESGEYDRHSFEVSKKMIRSLRHDRSALSEEDGAVEFKNSGTDVCFTNRVFSALVNSNIEHLTPIPASTGRLVAVKSIVGFKV